MKKIFIFLLVFFASASFLAVRAQSTGEEILSFGNKTAVNKDGTINVKETIIYSFGDLQKHGIYRTIPYIKTNSDGKKFQMTLSDFTVTNENDLPWQYTKSDDGTNITLKIGDANLLVSGVQTYVISYKVSGALTYFSDHDELYWNVTGNNWQIPILKYDSQITYPSQIMMKDVKTICYLGVVGSTRQDCYVYHARGMEEIMSKSVLALGEGMTAVVSFPKGIFAILEPIPYVPFEDTLMGKLVFLLIGLISLIWYVLLPVIIVILWWVNGRDPAAKVGVVAAWFDPPKSPKDSRFLTPGEVGTLGDETVDLKDISGTIIDLARRGFLKIEERSKGDFYFVKQKEYSGLKGLLPYEVALLDAFFSGKKESHLKDEDDLSEKIEAVKKSLYQDVVDVGLFPKNPQDVRTIYYVVAGIAIFTGNIPLAIISFLFGRAMPRKTQEGVDCESVAKSLKNFLQSQERQLAFQADKQMMFEKLLPYAIVFGVEKIWAKRFAELNMKNPSWYQGYGTSNFNTFIFVNSMNTSLKSFQTAATPTRSSSGFSSGFGGGGFSGGGGGGGGGGSW